MENKYLDRLVETIQSKDKLLARGGQTKTGILSPSEVEILDISPINGIREYNPSEYTFTAYAGTPLKDINQMLAENGQFLPFDPPLTDHGATLGGTVASNLSGPGRYHYGGVRDFILGVQFLDSQGRLIHTGGKVVKNAAGFDIPKLMVGSLGSLGAMVEVSIKVFPKPKETITAISRYATLPAALNSLIQLTSSSSEILCLELEPIDDSYDLRIRLGGEPKLFPDRISHLGETVGDIVTLIGDPETEYWESLNEFDWVPEGTVLVKIPLTPKFVPQLDEFLNSNHAIRHYSVGANVAWVALSQPLNLLDQKLKELNLMGLTVLGSADQIRLGVWEPGGFYRRIKNALDPSGLWLEV
ncbi:MAG: FAD-binding protein [Anaerolineales bacterium]